MQNRETVTPYDYKELGATATNSPRDRNKSMPHSYCEGYPRMMIGDPCIGYGQLSYILVILQPLFLPAWVTGPQSLRNRERAYPVEPLQRCR